MFSRLLASEPEPRNLTLAIGFFLLGLFNVWALIYEAREAEGVGAHELVTVPLLTLLMFFLGARHALPQRRCRTKKALEVAYVLSSLTLFATAVWFLLA